MAKIVCLIVSAREVSVTRKMEIVCARQAKQEKRVTKVRQILLSLIMIASQTFMGGKGIFHGK